MRDPDLVVQAQRAASALERAWRRWRTLHGLAADPTPPVSSYVGYSLDEPWGQPRVVFGLAADEAEQLAVLLERHDCVGPVHARVAPMAGNSWMPGAPGHPGQPVPLTQPVQPAQQLQAARGSRAAEASQATDVRQATQPGFAGQQRSPGQPDSPGEAGYAGQPGSPGQPGYAGQPGSPGQPGYAGQPRYAGESGPAGQPGYAGQAGYPGQPGAAIQPGFAGQQGYPAQPGQPGPGNRERQAGQPPHPGRPGRPAQRGPLPVPQPAPASDASRQLPQDSRLVGRGQVAFPPEAEHGGGRRGGTNPAAPPLRPQHPPSRGVAQQPRPPVGQPPAARRRLPEEMPVFQAAAAAAQRAAAARAAAAMFQAHSAAIAEDADRARELQSQVGPAAADTTQPALRRPPVTGHAAMAPRDGGGDDGSQSGPGPLSLAAAAARTEVETRIRSALLAQRAAPGWTGRGTAGAATGGTAPGGGLGPAEAGTGISSPRTAVPGIPAGPDAVANRPGHGVPPSSRRPEVASGATFIRPVGATHAFHPDAVSDPALLPPPWDALPEDRGGPAVVAFRPRPDLAPYLSAETEADPFTEQLPDNLSGGFGGRGRLGRGQPKPRLQHPDAAPGA